MFDEKIMGNLLNNFYTSETVFSIDEIKSIANIINLLMNSYINLANKNLFSETLTKEDNELIHILLKYFKEKY